MEIKLEVNDFVENLAEKYKKNEDQSIWASITLFPWETIKLLWSEEAFLLDFTGNILLFLLDVVQGYYGNNSHVSIVPVNVHDKNSNNEITSHKCMAMIRDWLP